MRVDVRENYNYLFEAVALATLLFQRNAGEAVHLVERRQLFMQDGVDAETRFADYKCFLERILALAEPLAFRLEDLRPLFLCQEGETGILQGLLRTCDATSIQDFSYASFQQAIRLGIYQLGVNADGAWPTQAEVEQVMARDLPFEEAFRIVEASSLADHQKLFCLRLIQDSAQLFGRIRGFLSELEAILCQELPAVDPYLQDFLKAAAAKGGKRLFQEAVGDFLQLDEAEFQWNKRLIIFPSAVDYNGASLRITVDQRLRKELSLGLLYQPLVSLKQQAARQQDVFLAQLKAISDPTRFEILHLLSDHSCYTKELADQLNLTSSTLSHHMASLMREDLVDYTIKGRRSYYSVRSPELIKLANALKDLAGRSTNGQDDARA